MSDSIYAMRKLERAYHAMIYDCDACEIRLIEFEPKEASMFPSEILCPGCKQMRPASYKIRYTHSAIMKQEAGP